MAEKKRDHVVTFKGNKAVLDSSLNRAAISESEMTFWKISLFISFTYALAITIHLYFPGPSDPPGISDSESGYFKRSSNSMQKMRLLDGWECIVCRPNYTKMSELTQVANKQDETGSVSFQGNFTADVKFSEIQLPPSLVRIRRGFNRSKIHFPKVHRIRRDTDQIEAVYATDFTSDDKTACKFPDSLQTAEIMCKMWPQTVTCISYCIYGHTHREGITRTHSCSYKKDKWSEKFEECKPFVDCKLKLRSPGFMKCVDKGINESPSCQISCEIYEDKNATDSKTYECKSDGTWKPELPHCAALKGTTLVSAPNVTKHVNAASFPKTQGIK